MDLMQRLLLQMNLPKPVPPGFTPVAGPKPVPPGFTPVQAPVGHPARQQAPLPAPVGRPGVPVVDGLPTPGTSDPMDNSSLGGDLKAGWLALQDFFPGGRMAGAAGDLDAATSEVQRAEQFAQDAPMGTDVPYAIGPDGPTLVNPVDVTAIPDAADMAGLRAGQASAQDAFDAVVAADLPGMLARAAQIAAIPLNPAAARMQDAETWGDTLSAVLSDPLGVTRTFFARSLPAQAPTVAGAVAGQRAGGPVGAALGAATASAATERNLSMAQAATQMLQEAGVDVTDEAAVGAFFRANPELVRRAALNSNIRAAVISAFDALSAGTAGRIASTFLKSPSTGVRVTGAGLGGAAETVGEGAGEAAAGLATTGKVDPAEVMAEMLGAAGPGTVQTGLQMAAEARRQAPAPAQPLPPTPDVVPNGIGEDPLAPSAQVPADPAPAVAAPQPESPVASEQNPQQLAQPAPPDAPPAAVAPDVPAPATPAVEPGGDSVPAVGGQPVDAPAAPPAGAAAPVATPAPPVDTPAPPSAPKLIRIPKRFYDDHSERDLPSPQIVKSDGKSYYVREDDPALDELLDDANHYATPNQFTEPELRGLVASARATAQSIKAHRDAAKAAQAQTPAAQPEPVAATQAPTPPEPAPTPAPAQSPMAMANAYAAQARATNPNRFLGKTAKPRALQAQTEMDALAADIAARTQRPATASEAKTQFDQHMNEFDALASSLKARLKLDDAEMPRVEYTLQRPSGTTKYTLQTGSETLGPRAQGQSKLKAFQQRMAKASDLNDPTNQTTTVTLAQMAKDARKPGGKPPPTVDPAEAARLASVDTPQPDGTVKSEPAVPLDQPIRKNEAPSVPPSRPVGSVGASKRFSDVAPDASEDTTRTPRGGFTRGTRDVSFTERSSIYDEAYRDAGYDPDEARLFTPVKRRDLLANLLESTFGLKIKFGTGRDTLRMIDQIAQMQDAYRNTRFMLAVLGLPREALSLGRTLSISFDRFRGQYLGAYAHGPRTIHMVGRSNSFAHEWMHALDHHLRNTLTPGTRKDLLSQVARTEGLNPHHDIQAAYVDLIHRMFFDEAELALTILDLEQQANAGSVDAARKLAEIDIGATKLKIAPSAYRQSSRDYDPGSGYWASVHEMMARAFEAYIASKVAHAGGTNEFITKGDEAYLSDADLRLAMTFPKAQDRFAIFDAFDTLFDHIRASAMFGTAPAEPIPTNRDVVDPAHWHRVLIADAKSQGLLPELKREFNVWRNAALKALASPGAALKSSASQIALGMGLAKKPGQSTQDAALEAAVGLWDTSRHFVNTMRANTKRYISRQPKDAQKFLEHLMLQLMTDPGTGKEGQGVTFEEYAERTVGAASARLRAVMKANKLGDSLSEADNNIVRKLVFGETVPNASPQLRALASTVSRIMEDTYRSGTKAGLDIGFVTQQGYLPRVIDRDAVENDRPGFLAKAGQVYGLVYDDLVPTLDTEGLADLANATGRILNPIGTNPFAAQIKALRKATEALAQAVAARKANPNAATNNAVRAAMLAQKTARDDLVADLRDPFMETSANDWMQRIIAGDAMTFSGAGPAANFTKKRTLPPATDTIMAEFHDTDVLGLVHSYVHGMARKAAYHERFGTPGGEAKLRSILSRQPVKDAVRQNPAKYNPDTAAGRFNILRDLTDPARDNIRAMAINEAVAFGADARMAEDMNALIEVITGRQGNNGTPLALKAMSAVNTVGTLALLPRVAWTSLTEPVAVALRTGDVKLTVRVLGFYARELARGSTSVQELAAMAEMAGIVSTPLFDALAMNRLAAGYGEQMYGGTVIARFHRANLLAQITNAQRRAVFAGSFYMMRDWAKGLQNPRTSEADKKIIRAEFRDLGVMPDAIDEFATWLAAQERMPTTADVSNPAVQQFMASAARLTDQTIQNPRRADKPMPALSPYGRVAYALTSFIYTFTRNILAATVNRMDRDYGIRRGEGESRLRAGASVALNGAVQRLMVGFALAWVGQVMVGIVRGALLDNDQWEKWGEEEDDEKRDGPLGIFPPGTLNPRQEWLARLAWSRTGGFGVWDVPYNAMLGLRYERDLTSLSSGSYLGYILSNTQNVLKAFAGRNSPNTNTTEQTAAKGAYRLTAAPIAAAIISAMPSSGVVGTGLKAIALQGATSNSAAGGFARALFPDEN